MNLWLSAVFPPIVRYDRPTVRLTVYLLCSCSSIMDPPDFNQPPGFGGANQVRLEDVFLLSFLFVFIKSVN